MSNVKIIQNEQGTKVLIDGRNIEKLRYVEYTNGKGSIPLVKIEFIPEELEMNMEGEI